ncbi:hypothetical protein EJ110_NYTH14807 [Nymphaea thermarum]|nr:hypothetical protein EJ110_NYTH14807 [Nymphaea thermarum]
MKKKRRRPNSGFLGVQDSRRPLFVVLYLLFAQSRLPGMKSDANLKPKAYKAIEQKMIEQFGPGFTVEKIKNKLKITKADYNMCKQILATSGFGWDSTNKCVVVENEVWAEYIKKFPERRKFKRGQKWKHYDQLHEVYGPSSATGRNAKNCDSFMMTEECESNQAPETPVSHTNDFGINIEENISFTQMLNGDSPMPSPAHVQQDSQPVASDSRATNSSNKRARISTNDEEYRTIFHNIADSFRTIVNTSSGQKLDQYLDILREMLDSGEIDHQLHLRALMLMEHGNKPAIFLKLLPIELMLSDDDREQVIVKMMFVLVFIFFKFLHRPRQIVHPYRNAGSQFVHNIIDGHPRNCLDLLRMDCNSFITLCNILKEKNLVQDGRAISIEEQVAIFLLTVGHNEWNRACQNTFQHSGQTISKYVNLILRALCQLDREYISRLNDDIPSKIRFNPRFYPYFKDCLGDIDDTQIPVWVRTSEQARFRNRKGTISQNVLAVVGFDMRFHYVFAGKYYLGDGGYPNIRGLLTPYRGHRYHISEFNAPGARRVTSKEELFNHRHSSLRTTVERVFGRLKGRFPILKAQVSYPYRTQVGIVLATCVLHNFIIDHNPNAEQFEPDEEIQSPYIGRTFLFKLHFRVLTTCFVKGKPGHRVGPTR